MTCSTFPDLITTPKLHVKCYYFIYTTLSHIIRYWPLEVSAHLERIYEYMGFVSFINLSTALGELVMR